MKILVRSNKIKVNNLQNKNYMSIKFESESDHIGTNCTTDSYLNKVYNWYFEVLKTTKHIYVYVDMYVSLL